MVNDVTIDELANNSIELTAGTPNAPAMMQFVPISLAVTNPGQYQTVTEDSTGSFGIPLIFILSAADHLTLFNSIPHYLSSTCLPLFKPISEILLM